MNSEVRFMAVFSLLATGFGALFYMANRPVIPRSALPVPTYELYDKVTRSAPLTCGNAKSETVLIEFADFDCPSCRKAYPTVESYLQKHANSKFIFWPLPTRTGTASHRSAVAGLVASNQGKFYAMYQALFAPKIGQLRDSDIEDCALKSELDMKKFHIGMQMPEFSDAITQQAQFAHSLGIYQTPTFLVKNPSGKLFITNNAEQAVGDLE